MGFLSVIDLRRLKKYISGNVRKLGHSFFSKPLKNKQNIETQKSSIQILPPPLPPNNDENLQKNLKKIFTTRSSIELGV